MNNTSITFTSNIRFVNRAVYDKLSKANRIYYDHNRVNLLKADEFFSEEIRTCTGGGLVNPKSEAEGFHFWDDAPNRKNFSEYINRLFRFVKNPKRGLLLGGKELEGHPYSIEQIEKFKKVFLERVENLSIFEKYRYQNAETHFHYSLKNDTWTLLTTFRRDKNSGMRTVKNIDDLLECFENIFIAEGDRLFIGKKEILPENFPQIFV